MSIRRGAFVACLLAVCLLTVAQPAIAQVIPGWTQQSFKFERIDEDRYRLTTEVEIQGEPGSPNAGQKFYADDLELNVKTGDLTAKGNVVFETPTARISSETLVFNTKTRRGTFNNASGISQLGERGQRNLSMFGTLEPDVYFYGQVIEKIGDDKYKITKGWFTTCVQPTPRWEIITNSAVVNLDDYVMLKNAVVNVKNVPVFYLPVLYYPIQEDDRATGILMPMYGASSYRGQSISNAFFWAINRSQDATFFHDWYFTRGQGMGSEYRYTFGAESTGNFRAYWLNEKETEIKGSKQPARRSSQITGGMSQKLPLRMTARARVDYFTDVTVQQLYNHNFYDASRSTRTVTGGVSGAWRGLSMNTNYARTESFGNTSTDSIVSGQAPGINVTYASPQLGIPLFATVNAEATRFIYQNKTSTGIQDLGLTKMDLLPTLRAPLSKLPFLTATATLAYRTTYFSESLGVDKKTQVDDPVTRTYADMRADVVGPVVSKVYSPNNAFAGRLKHIIEPSWSITRRTKINNQDRISNAGGGGYDTVIGGSTSMTYGLANRILVRKTGGDQSDPSSAPREFLNVSLRQTYYTDELASRFDSSYSYGYLNRANNPFSPVALVARAAPTLASSVDFRLEYDPVKEATQHLLGFGLNGTLRMPAINATGGWSRRPDPRGPGTNYIQSQVDLRIKSYGGAVMFNYDIAREVLQNQRYVAFYNAQCCGVSFEWQAFHYPNTGNFPIPEDRRFSLSFTLAGVGSFSNFLGAFGVGTQ